MDQGDCIIPFDWLAHTSQSRAEAGTKGHTEHEVVY